ncbi:hypothetical protein M422DRAFT_261083 [Sphaerobolus stellatus SS14]|uniref:Uncharacterized protein n=1 Tax=Sphaerobolus stellatus (strain SS14) TaxID=990650 RepID=A0A0C9U178_SPHS4|nr:hypothetical protein M422DRAFT_261083 [Sphaerobolus stellatus SS14]
MPDDVIRTDHAFWIFCDNVALPRFMSGQDLYITPRNGVEFYNTLRSYTFDALHNLISQSRRELPVGGYSLACEVASNSILAMLGTDPNTSYLLSLHPPTPPTDAILETRVIFELLAFISSQVVSPDQGPRCEHREFSN